jgi:hypothetical protein
MYPPGLPMPISSLSAFLYEMFQLYASTSRSRMDAISGRVHQVDVVLQAAMPFIQRLHIYMSLKLATPHAYSCIL